MFKSKKDVDKHVEKLQTKLTNKEFNARGCSIARLYFDVGDYGSCRKYVESYLIHKQNNAAAYKLLGEALQKLGQKDKALDQFKMSLDIDPTHYATILDICELLSDEDISIDLGSAKYWFEKAEELFPKHPVTFRLRERLLTISDPDPEALIQLLNVELNVRPRDPILHSRLIKYYVNMNKFVEAFEHSCKIEFSSIDFSNNYPWYEVLDDLLRHDLHKADKCFYQLLVLTVKERLCLLSLTETPSGTSKSIVESAELLHSYDQALESVAKAGAAPGFAEFHSCLLQHHRGQFSFHAATLLLKRANKNITSWSESTIPAASLMVLAWQTVPLDSNVNWLKNASEKVLNAVNRWYSEGTYRCSQSGHFLLTNFQEKNQSLLDQISQCCSGSHWKEKLYAKIFTDKSQVSKIKASHFNTKAFNAPQLRLPRKNEVEADDNDAQKQYGNSLHHFVWTLLNYKNYADFKCSLFDMLTPTATSSGPETLNKLDIYAFLYCAALTTEQQNSNKVMFVKEDKPKVLPANITDILCPLPQMKWWDCAYKFSQNILGTELTDIRATLSRGIEVVRCIDNHSIDPELLCHLGRIFSEQAKKANSLDEKNFIETRAVLYYGLAIPQLEKLKSNIMIKVSDKRLFDYTHKIFGTKELNTLIEESKIYVAINSINNNEYEKAIELLTNIKSPQAYYHLAEAYKKAAVEESYSSIDGTKSKYAALLNKAITNAYKALDLFKQNETNKSSPLYSKTQELIEDIEICLNKMDLNTSKNYIDARYSSDDDVSYQTEPPRTNRSVFRNISSTPKTKHNNTNYQTAIDSQILENTRMEQKHLEKIGNEIKNLQRRDETITDFMEQTKSWFEENRNLGNKIINTINSNIQNTTDQFKDLKIAVEQVKDQIDECRIECKDVGELKKQLTELRKEVDKLKKSSSEQAINESDLYNLDEEFRANETGGYGSQLPFTPQMMPPFNQRSFPPVPPNPYQLYNQTLFNLYNQYSHIAQTSSVPGPQHMFDPSRAQMNFPGVYPTPDQMFLDMAHLIPPASGAVPPAAPVPTIPVPHSLPAATIVPPAPVISTIAAPTTSVFSTNSSSLNPSKEQKDSSRSIPVNVVITSSEPLPTPTSAPAPVLRVTIPPKHIKSNQPHNYQIPLPTPTETKVASPPAFSFTMPENKNNPVSSLSNWNKAFESFPEDNSLRSNTSLDPNNSVVERIFAGASPNTSINKSRTLSEKSNTSVENYDPCPDFKPIIPLPAEVAVNTGEEDEIVLFSSRAKLYRFVDKQWKERGLGEMKLLKHKTTGKVRVLMRREQVHKICANHIITAEMEINPMKNETKAYIWVANDFAEESVMLEKFCVRFKTAEIASQFYGTFEKARQESVPSQNDSKQTPTKPDSVPQQTIDQSGNTFSTNQPKTESNQPKITTVGGFTFNSTPLFKPVQNDKVTENKSTEPEASKNNVFSNLSFKTGGTSQFSNLFNITSVPATTSTDQTEDINKSKLNSSDTVEEFEPNVEFKPVIALPALVEQITGEENENILFEHRAKLLRYDSNAKEWKERGLGNIKLLAHKNNSQKVRLLMRREQIMKVCCNHGITKEMNFQKMPNMDKAVTWCAKDFSEGELVSETFCLRFKTVESCDNFIEAIKTVQIILKDDSKASKDAENAPQQTNSSGFGDKFKPKVGSWYCQGCYTNNLESFEKCACCDQPKPKTGGEAKVSAVISKDPKDQPKSSWGDEFKPKPGSWECKSCFVRNEATLENCNACNSPKDPTVKKPSVTTYIKTNFTFGIPQQPTASKENQKVISTKTAPPAVVGFGDMFKPKEGSWECQQCLLRNVSNLENCCACNSPKDPNAPKKNNSLLDTSTKPSTVKYSFGIPPTAANTETPKFGAIFEGTAANKFSFGIPSTQTPFSQETSKTPAKIDTPLNFSSKANDQNTKTEAPSCTAAAKDTGFGFVFKTSAPKSTVKTPQKKEDESDGEDLVKDEDCTAEFTPVIPLPEKVDVVTGEEKEEELYAHRARLYIFVSSEWKERGTGIVKILKHNETSKLRVVMRREQVLKICLNHALTSDITYSPKDKKSWLFAANDFSEGELTIKKFCLRFSNEDIALQFKDALDKALQGELNAKSNAVASIEKTKSLGKKDEDDDVVFISETQANAEDKQKATDLMLPINFYTYKNKERCEGCRGCSDESDSDTQQTKTVSEVAADLLKERKQEPPLVTPVKVKLPAFHSPAISLYGTPGNDKSFDTSVFRTPLGTSASSTLTSTPTDANNTTLNATNKENVFSLQSNSFMQFGGQSSIFGTPQGTPTQGSLFDTKESQNNAFGIKGSFLAPPKLSAINTSGETKATEPKSIFSSAQTKLFGESAFGISNNKSIFDFAANKSSDQKGAEIKSLFGGNEKSVNLFSGTSQGSIFGPGALNNNQPKLGDVSFGSGSTGSIFSSGNSTNESSKISSIWNQPADKKTEVVELPLKLENNLSFATLSTSGPSGFEKKAENFKWEGTGQQLFTAGQKKDASKTGDDSANAEEEFDPHYEPIVPLPDEIVVTTGEEEETKLFGERGKVYRFDDKNKEWKERGVGELKILHHPQNNTYRLLLRREQIYKAVLNMLLHTDIELLPMKNTETAWTFAGKNFAENPSGEYEMLAVRFKGTQLANSFRDQVNQCVRKLQAAAANAIREEKEAIETKDIPATITAAESKEAIPAGIAPLRLPKHVAQSARGDAVFAAAAHHAGTLWTSATAATAATDTATKPNGNQGQLQERVEEEQDVEEEEEDDEEDDDDENYEDDDQGDSYYNEEDAYYTCEGEAIVAQGSEVSSCPHASIQVLFEQDIYSPKILVTDADTGEILADMLIHTDTEFQMNGDSCKWTGIDYTSNEPVDKTVTINFYDSDSAMQFFDSVETSKHATYTSNDPE